MSSSIRHSILLDSAALCLLVSCAVAITPLPAPCSHDWWPCPFTSYPVRLRGGGAPGVAAATTVCCQHNATADGNMLPVRIVLQRRIPQICEACATRTFGARAGGDVLACVPAAAAVDNGGEGGASFVEQPSRLRKKQTIFVPEPAPQWASAASSETRSTHYRYSHPHDGSEPSTSDSEERKSGDGLATGLGSTSQAVLETPDSDTGRGGTIGQAKLSGLALKRANALARQRCFRLLYVIGDAWSARPVACKGCIKVVDARASIHPR